MGTQVMKRNTGFWIWIVVATVVAILQTCPVSALIAEEGLWPREIFVEGGRVVMYQPQPEELDGNLLASRAAVSIEMDEDDGPVFGAVWFDARLNTDRDARTATITDVRVTNVRFPDQEEEKERKLKALLESEIPEWNVVMDLDSLLATLELAEKRNIAAQRINTAPPRIIFVPEPAVLVIIDGEPRLQNIENSNLMRVKNTPFTILFSLSEKRYYLFAGKGAWYVSRDIKENWQLADAVPSEVAAMAPKPGEESQQVTAADQDLIKSGPPPLIIVSTEPAELISSYGKPEYTPISGTDLLYMSNTDSDVLMHIMDREYYILLSGRWYRSASLQGPWEYVAGEELPADFSRIPEDSPMGTVLYAVPGTDVAKEAVLDAYIPQTAAIDPNRASLTVEYDGKPRFEQIQGTHLYYAVNTAIPVIWEGKWYYACDQAVWFVAPSPKGPWTVATSVPDSIYLIPPESPVYNVTFVRVYQATPDVVYVGYTPGYTNTYVYYDTIVYGTGYHWPGWYGDYYYPRYSTWGYHARWNPWYGWGFGISYSNSPFYFSIGTGDWYMGSWWGPSYYREYRHGYYHRYRREKHIGYRAGYEPGGPRPEDINIYRSRRNKVRLIPAQNRPYIRTKKDIAVPGRENNVYVDREGNVHRKTEQGWQTRVKDKWLQMENGKQLETRPATGPVPIQRPRMEGGKSLPSRPATGPVSIQRPRMEGGKSLPSRPATGPASSGPPQQYRRELTAPKIETPQLDQSYKARQQGENRARSFNGTIGPKNAAPSFESSRGGGPRR